MQTYLAVNQPMCVRQWRNVDGRRSRSRSRNCDPRAGPQGACDDGSGAGGRSSLEGLPARPGPLSGRGFPPPQSGGWPHPRSGSESRGGGGGGSDRPCEERPPWRESCSEPVYWRQPRCDGGGGVRADGSLPHSSDFHPYRLQSQDGRPPARSDAHYGERGGGGGGGYGGGYCGDRGGGGSRYVGGGKYGREDEGSGAGPSPCWLRHTDTGTGTDTYIPWHRKSNEKE